MPYNYNDPRQYQFKPTKGQHVASGIGALIAAALAATQGQNTGDAMARAAAGAVSGYGGGMSAANQEYEDMFNRTLARDKFGFDQQQYEESEKPYRKAMTGWYNQRDTGQKEFNTPGDLDTFLASKAGRFGLDYSNNADRMKMLQLFGRQDTGLSREYNQWKPSLAPSIYNVIPGYQTPEGQPKTYDMRKGITSKESSLQKTPSEADVKFERDYTTADALLDELESSFEANKDALPQDATERITEYPSRQVGKALQTESGVGLKNLESLRIAIMPKMIRALGEVGTLTDADINRVNQAIPTINDVESVRKNGFQQIRNLIKEVNMRGKRQENVIPNKTAMPREQLETTQPQSLEHFISEAGKVNPGASYQELADYYNKKYGNK